MNPENSKHIAEFVTAGLPTFTSFDDLLELTMKFNPNRSESSLRRGILHNAEQLDDGSWVWRHSRWRVTDPDEARRYEEARARAEAEAADAKAGDDPAGTPPAALFDDLLDAARRIHVPTLLARGMRADSVLRDDDESRFLTTVAGGEVLHFEEAGHSIQGDMPIELAATIAEFVPHA